MSEKKPTPRSTKIVAAGVFGGLVAATVGQKYFPWTLESQTHTIVVVLAGLVVAATIAWFATRKRPASPAA